MPRASHFFDLKNIAGTMKVTNSVVRTIEGQEVALKLKSFAFRFVKLARNASR